MKNDYLVQKKPLSALLIFALPIVIGNLFQQLYTMADSAIVGHYVSEGALAAVGASYSLTNVFICIAVGGGMGASVVVGRYYGAHRYTDVKRAFTTSFIAFGILSLLLGGIGLLFSRQIMFLLQTPEDVLDRAAEYLNIYFLGLPFLFLYNILSSMFNALGKSRIPLYFLIFSSVLNVALDLLMVTVFQWGVAGAAWATLIAQGLSAILSFFFFLRELKALHCGKAPLFDTAELSTMTRIALPSMLQQSTVSIGMMLVQSVVNSFGSQALAGFSAGMRIESLCIVPMISIGNALSAYTAQNIGAGQYDRVTSGYHIANRMVIVCAVFLCIALELFYRPFITFFLGESGTATALETGENYLRFIGWFFCLIGFKMAVDSLLRGAGDMKMFTIANLVNLLVRVAVAMIFAPIWGIAMVWYAVPIGWFLNWLISYRQYRTGKWRSIYQKGDSQ